jgi:hypothetical protein
MVLSFLSFIISAYIVPNDMIVVVNNCGAGGARLRAHPRPRLMSILSELPLAVGKMKLIQKGKRWSALVSGCKIENSISHKYKFTK